MLGRLVEGDEEVVEADQGVAAFEQPIGQPVGVALIGPVLLRGQSGRPQPQDLIPAAIRQELRDAVGSLEVDRPPDTLPGSRRVGLRSTCSRPTSAVQVGSARYSIRHAVVAGRVTFIPGRRK